MNIQRVNGLTFPMPNMQQCNPTTTHTPAVVSDANTVLTIPTSPNCDDFSLLDCPSAPPLFQHPPHILSNNLFNQVCYACIFYTKYYLYSSFFLAPSDMTHCIRKLFDPVTSYSIARLIH